MAVWGPSQLWKPPPPHPATFGLGLERQASTELPPRFWGPLSRLPRPRPPRRDWGGLSLGPRGVGLFLSLVVWNLMAPTMHVSISVRVFHAFNFWGAGFCLNSLKTLLQPCGSVPWLRRCRRAAAVAGAV